MCVYRFVADVRIEPRHVFDISHDDGSLQGEVRRCFRGVVRCAVDGSSFGGTPLRVIREQQPLQKIMPLDLWVDGCTFN